MSARAIDRMVVRGCVSKEARDFLREFAENDPVTQAAIAALDEVKHHAQQSKSNSRAS